MTPDARPISIHAEDLDASVAFYTDVFGMERIPSPDPGDPVVYLLLGDQELELVLRKTFAPDATTLDPLVVGDIRSRHGAGHGR